MDYETLRSTLISKGEAEEDRKKHHIFFFVFVDGKQYRATKISHGARGQITVNILSQIARQMRLTNRELKYFVTCEISRDKWIELWKKRGYGWHMSN